MGAAQLVSARAAHARNPRHAGNSGLLGIANRPPSLAIGPSADILRRLELTVMRRLDGMLQGDYRGLVPGHGSELGETREYTPGDDVRRIDWNVTARMTHPHVRETIADRELETWVLADLSASLGFGTAECEKRDLAIAAIAAVGYLTQRTGNRIGAIALEGDRTITVPAKTGRLNLQALLHRVVMAAKADHDGASDLGAGIQRLSMTMRRRGLAVVMSDFLTPDNWQRPLRALAARHETLVIEILDPRELDIPNVGMLEVFDPETGDIREINTRSEHVRAAFRDEALRQREVIARQIRETGADHLILRTDSDWLLDLVRFVSWRRERVDALARVQR
jgi:uncharacterized protein (DUF58 family)